MHEEEDPLFVVTMSIKLRISSHRRQEDRDKKKQYKRIMQEGGRHSVIDLTNTVPIFNNT